MWVQGYWEMYVAGLGTHCGKKSAEGRVIWGCVLLGSFTDRKRAGSVPHSSNRCLTEKIFSQLEREGRENICFTIHHRGGGENWGEKTPQHVYFTVHEPIYCPQGWSREIPLDGQSLSPPPLLISHNSLGPCPYVDDRKFIHSLCGLACLMINVRKQQLVSIYNTLL